ncbi:4'-phosphopantetheinyl transferase [Kwoniella mangroviensis CBS 10435]|uniref:holo-[acyl-carrier-protein] synthase n=1 Tax=Kwoniella mangroviensis CBS 10435 TaxID=1331196 RepID=A0A1B9J208_9TREE|nr:4'-phosphopantetheinyl transferase [Kwoniella mangroviensis CBS 10435]
MKIYAIKIPDQPIPNETFDKLLLLMEPQGRERVKRFRLWDDALRSLVARLTMTWYLTVKRLLVDDKLPTFGRKGKGKPTLASPTLNPPLEFNNTHESSYILFAVLRSPLPLACVGIDIMSPVSDPVDTQEGIFDQLTLMEKLSLAGKMSDQERNKRLMNLWTLKEGYTKAVGEGITFGLERIEVILDDQGDVQCVKVDGKDSEDIGWNYKLGNVEGNRWAVWWRGDDTEEEGGVKFVDVRWEEFEKPLVDLVVKLGLQNGQDYI